MKQTEAGVEGALYSQNCISVSRWSVSASKKQDSRLSPAIAERRSLNNYYYNYYLFTSRYRTNQTYNNQEFSSTRKRTQSHQHVPRYTFIFSSNDDVREVWRTQISADRLTQNGWQINNFNLDPTTVCYLNITAQIFQL